MSRVKWTTDEEILLTEHWNNSTKEVLREVLPNRSWSGLVHRAHTLKLPRDSTHININTSKRRSFVNGISHLDRLLEDSAESYYWAGFIAADGHVNTNTHRLVIGLSLKDLNHLQKFANFINYAIVSQNESKNTCTVAVQDKNIIKEFAEKFKFSSNKTHNLVDPDIKDDDLFLSFLIGFIDGDGRVAKLHNRPDAHIDIVGHGNSLEVFKKWFARLFKLFPSSKSNSLILGGSVPKLDKRGYARGFISNFEVVKQIKIKAIELRLPAMSRKWDCVDMTLVSKYVITSERRKKAKQLRDQGLTRTEIAKELGVTISATYRYFLNT